MKVHILDLPRRHPIMPSPADWYPVYLNQRLLETQGLSIKFFTETTEQLTDCDALCLSSRYFALHTKSGAERQQALDQIASFKQNVPHVLWFDFRDSTGSASFEVLPYVDRYLKKQLLNDYSLYRKPLYGNRVYTDYIHHQLNITDDYEEPQEPLPQEHEYKLGISWNPGLLDFRGGTNSALIWQRFTDHFAAHLGTHSAFKWHDPHAKRQFNMLALFNTNYERNTVAWQRRNVRHVLDQINDDKIIYQDKLPLKQEIAARYNAKIVLSLFGWGELCSRDYQTFIAGAALIAPDSSHLSTWPVTHIPNETYAPIKWDLSDLPAVYQQLIEDKQGRIKLATAGQQTYRRLWSKHGRQQFAKHFKNLLTKPTIQTVTASSKTTNYKLPTTN